MIFIIKRFRIIVFIFIVISMTYRPKRCGNNNKDVEITIKMKTIVRKPLMIKMNDLGIFLFLFSYGNNVY